MHTSWTSSIRWVFLISEIILAEWVSLGDKHSFVCSRNRNNITAISWIKTTNGFEETLFFCDLTPINKSCLPAQENLPYHATTFLEGDSIKSILEINRITLDLHKSLWKCVIGVFFSEVTVLTFDLFVFALPEKIMCNNPVRDKEVNITVQCVTEKISPEAVCEFFVKSNNTEPVSAKNNSVTYANWPSEGYNSTECNMTISGVFLGIGSHEFYVVMYPNITSYVPSNIHRKSNDTDVITINNPRAALSLECLDGKYIKENESGMCRCFDTYNNSFFPTKTVWSNMTGNNDVLTFEARRPLNGVKQTFLCTIINTLNWRDTISYQPIVAYPPESFNVTLFNTEIDKCYANNNTISGYCLASDSFPKPEVYVNIRNFSTYLHSEVNTSVYKFETTLNATGIFNLTCQLNNTLYLANAKTSVVIKGPPEAPTIVDISNGSIIAQSEKILKVRNGGIIMCQSKGGFPHSKNISFTCGNNETLVTSSMEEDPVSLKLNITRSKIPMNITCTCMVSHESQCLPNVTSVMIFLDSDDGTQLESGYSSELDPDFLVTYLGVGVSFGVVLLALVAILSLSKIRHNQLKNSASGILEKLVNNSEIYFMKEDEMKDKLPIEYSNLVSSMISAVEVPRNLKAK